MSEQQPSNIDPATGQPIRPAHPVGPGGTGDETGNEPPPAPGEPEEPRPAEPAGPGGTGDETGQEPPPA